MTFGAGTRLEVKPGKNACQFSLFGTKCGWGSSEVFLGAEKGSYVGEEEVHVQAAGYGRAKIQFLSISQSRQYLGQVTGWDPEALDKQT